MINYRQIGNLQEQIFDQIGAAESFRSFVYHDSVGVPTLGYGFALLVRDESDRYVIRDDLSGALSAIDIEIDGEFQNTLDEAIDLLNAGNVAGSSALFPGPNANIADDPLLNTMGITIDENQGRTLFNYASADAVASLWGRLRISGDDSLFNAVAGQEASVDYTTRSAVKQAYIDGDIPGTKEFVALVSLAYNGPELKGITGEIASPILAMTTFLPVATCSNSPNGSACRSQDRHQ